MKDSQRKAMWARKPLQLNPKELSKKSRLEHNFHYAEPIKKLKNADKLNDYLEGVIKRRFPSAKTLQGFDITTSGKIYHHSNDLKESRSIIHKEQVKGNYDLEDECHACGIKHRHKISLHNERNINKIGNHWIGKQT